MIVAMLLAACGGGTTGGEGNNAGNQGAQPGATQSGNAGNAGQGTKRLSIATGGTSGVYFVYGGGLADQITSGLKGYEATAEVTSASVDNMVLIEDKQSDIAFSLADTAADAVQGKESFKNPVPARALAQLYLNYTQVVTLANKGIKSIEDLKGKKVSLGSPNSGTEVIALRVLEAAGLNPDQDINRQGLGVGESVSALRDGTIDAFFWSGGVPTAGVTDLASTNKIVLLPTDQYADALQKKYGQYYTVKSIPSGSYKGVDQEVKVIAVPNYLVVHEAMDEELAYQLTKLLFEKKDALVKVHPEAKNLQVQTATEVAPLKLHPGAQRYYDEAGKK